ncbi:MAG: glycerol acyltransferase, partial [Frankia sp.]|nr:glycerol acyltransferase [Frankia sp.]
PGRSRTLRLTTFFICYLALEVVGLIAMFVLWVVSGFGLRLMKMHDIHYAFMRWWLLAIHVVARRIFKLRVWIEERPTPKPGPILVFCRHAGPGNSLLLIGTLLVGYRRHPRIVMLAKLQWEPLYDVMLNRLPNRFIKHDPKRRNLYLQTIGDLATGLGDQDAFVLFPEGKDFTPRVRRRAIDFLHRKGHRRHAERAEKMEHVLPPRHGGVMAAIRAAPDADVVFVAHAVLEDVGTFGELWSRIPLQRPIPTRFWRIPPSEVPTDEAELIDWLYEWWERIDAWIEEHSAPGAVEAEVL